MVLPNDAYFSGIDWSISLEKYHIYMADSSRVSIAGLNEANVAYVAAGIDNVVRNR